MKCCLLALVVVVACGPAKPAVTVPAPVVKPEADKPIVVTPPPPEALIPPAPTLRLPRNFLPTGYTARLEIDPAKAGFEGSIQIAGTVSEKSLVIWLFARHLAIHKAVAQGAAGEVALTAKPVGEDLLELRAARPLDAGAWTIALDYAGVYELASTAGAFKQTVDGAPYVYSQLEALYGRRVFPCFDEPDNKVPWKLTLDVPAKLTAVANTSVAAETPLDSDRKRVEFAVTKPLPSYLVAFGVGPFEIVDAGKTKHGTPVRIVTLAHRSADAAYAAKSAAKLVDYVEDWFASPFPYDKLDFLTIPLTVGFSAMENAGLITVAETAMLFDAKASKARQHFWISAASHEIAHQWFGDLVTMAYWDDVWLNEGFATWMASKIAVRFDPAWHDQLSELDERDLALGADALVSARQVRQPIGNRDDILTAFDGITYQKGASVLNMFESYLGVDTFQRGVRDYLAARAWGNATSADFVAAISKAANRDVGPAFATFLDQAGAPELTATLACSGGKASVALAQQRFVPPGAPPPAATKPWIVPVCVAFDAGGRRTETCMLLDQPTGTLALDTAKCPRWVMPNINGRGYYRIAYTAPQIATLRDEAWPQLNWNERRAIFHDVAGSAEAGRLPLQVALSLVPKLLAGNDRFSVPRAVELVIGLERWVPDELRPKYEAWVRQTFGPGAQKIGIASKDSDSLDVEEMRGQLIGAVAWYGRDPKLVEDAVKLAERWRELPQASGAQVLQIAADARPDVFDRVLKEVASEPAVVRREMMLGALATVRDPKRQEAALGLILDSKLDVRETLGMLEDTPSDQSRATAQAFFRAHEAQIMTRLPRDGTAGPAAGIAGIFTTTCRADQRDATVDYVRKTFGKLAGAERVLAQKIEDMDHCIAKRKLLDPEVRGWLEGYRIPAPPKK